MEKSMKDVMLILPNYAPDDEVAERAIRFMRNLDDTTTRGAKIICIDNGTVRDSSLKARLLMILANAGTLLHYDRPLGYARAVNIGLAMTDTKYVVVLNNDLELPAGWLPTLIQTYESGGGPGVLSAMDHPCRPIFYDDSWYSLWMSDRETITEVGYMDGTLPFRYHDQDYSIRMYKAGFKVQRTGLVVVGHDEATTYKKMTVDEVVERERMMSKHGAYTYREWREMGGRPFGK